MKLTSKFSVIYVLIFGSGLAGAGYICRDALLDNARAQVLQEAHLMLDSSLATREYTSKHVGPLIYSLRAHDKVFRPETVPAFAATQHFSYLHGKYPDYSYREPTLIPTNLRDEPADWERDIIQYFRDRRTETEKSGERETTMGRVLWLAKPVVANQSCLHCHNTREEAPASMVAKYGDHGFGWKLDEVVGAFVVTVPMELPINRAKAAFSKMMLPLVLLAIFVLIAINLAIRTLVIRPVTRLVQAADEVSKGQVNAPDIPADGKDEVSLLAASFNRMRRSLASAMKMLEQQ